MSKTVVIIGGGIAGVSAAEEIRARDLSCDIFLIERENNPLYSRVLLPHYIKGLVPREKVFLRTDAWYAEKRIFYLSGTEANEISTEHQFVRISDGREIPYDILIFATGTRPRLLENDAKGVHYLFSLADADGIRAHIGRFSEGEKTLVYGGGFIACEFINLLVHAGKIPTVLLRGEGFWSKFLLPEGQEIIRKVLHDHRIPVVEHVGNIELVVKDDAVKGVKDEKGAVYEGTFLGVGIGAELECELAHEANLPTEKGVLADASLFTGVQGVYTAGDVAQAFDEQTGRARNHGNWAHALQEGKKAAKTALGEVSLSIAVSQYATDLLGTKIAFLGDMEKDAASEVRVVPTESGYVQVFLRKGILVGAILLGNMTDRMRLAGMIGKSWE